MNGNILSVLAKASTNSSTRGERFEDFLSLHGHPSEYGYAKLGDLYYIFEWIASCLVLGNQKGVINTYLYVLPKGNKEDLVKFELELFFFYK